MVAVVVAVVWRSGLKPRYTMFLRSMSVGVLRSSVNLLVGRGRSRFTVSTELLRL